MKQNTDGLKKGHIWSPDHMIPEQAYKRLFEHYCRQVDDGSDIKSAFGIKFEDPTPVSDSLVAQKDYLVPVEIYNDNGDEDLILINHILKMNMHSAIYLQYFFGAIGPRYIRVPPQDWVTLEHRFYIGYLKSGRPPKITGTTGNHKGKGVKGASRPQ